MRQEIGFIVVAVLTAVQCEPVAAQLVPNPTQSGASSLWQSADQAAAALSSPRQSPNQAPATPAQPASDQTTSTAAPWYPQSPGMPVAGGTLYSGVTAGAYYDDNVFATNSNPMSDWAVFARPEFGWVTKGQNSTFAVDGFIEGRDYARFSSEDQINGSVGAGFTVMPDNNTQIIASARYIHEHLDRGSSETVITTPGQPEALISTLFANPVSYDQVLETAALNKRYGNWWSSLGAAGMEVEFQNPTIGSSSPLSGTGVDLSYADGLIAAANVRAGYVVMPLTSVFVEGAVNTREWQVDYFNSQGYRVVAGLLFEQGPGARLKGEAWGGYMDQQYSGITMQNVSSWTYGVSLVAVVTNNIDAVVEGRREAKESALGLAALPSGDLGASAPTCTIDTAVCVSTIESEAGGRLDYHILPKVIIGGGVTYLEDEYQGPLAFGRVDETLSPLASVKYLATPNVTLGFDYRNVAFNSSGGSAPVPFTSVAALPYSRNVYMFSANGTW
jgi:hypothetical protein